MDSEDGQIFVKNLAQFVRTHEKALANALQLRRQAPKNGQSSSLVEDASPTKVSDYQNSNSSSSASSALAAALSLGSLSFSSHNIKPAKLALTPHHLYYLLDRFEDLGIPIGPMNVRLENIHTEASPANYVSFLGQSQGARSRSDRDSIHSVSSVRSVMSGLWPGFGLGSSSSAGRTEKAKVQLLTDLKYLYSAFTKIPCLRLSPDRKARLIGGYEEFPFDTAVPLLAFKNVSALEVCDVDFRQFYGWDRMAEQLRSLTVKRSNLDDPTDLFVNIVLDDMEKRRRRSSKASNFPVLPWPASPSLRFNDTGKPIPTPGSPMIDHKLGQSASPQSSGLQFQHDQDAQVSRKRTRTKRYSEDIMIDSTGPGYSERRQLSDRIVEPEGASVVKPIYVEPAPDPPMAIKDGGEAHGVQRPSPPQYTQSEITVGSGRRRKGPRRRIVDLAVEQNKGRSLASEIQGLNLNGEAYKQKIEALKSELGSNWLSILDWNDGQKLEASHPRFHHINTMRPETPAFRSSSQGITSGHRTLG
ncbi:hypothetical protein P7C71_g1930, partial [Lecanoromycetidae sp. Uapishka_2]